MERKQRLNMAASLISDLMNQIIDRHANDGMLNTYAIRYSNYEEGKGFSVQSTHGTNLYCAESIIDIVRACDLLSCISVERNLDDELTPTINIF